MKTSISNLAWDREEDDAVKAILLELGIAGVEIAPGKVWPTPLDATGEEIAEYRAYWARDGVRICAMQALMYGKNDLLFFGSDEARERALSYLEGILRLGGRLGAYALVLGSPGNRRTMGRPPAEVENIAIPFFRRLGETAVAEGVCLRIEPNPAEYGCDFACTVEDAAALVRKVDSDGFGLHLDSGGMHMNGEVLESLLSGDLPEVRHFHVSEPFLAPVGDGAVDVAGTVGALREHGYGGWVSIEMLCKDPATRLADIRRALVSLP